MNDELKRRSEMESLVTIDMQGNPREFLIEVDDLCQNDKHQASEYDSDEEINVHVFERPPVMFECYNHTFSKVDAGLFQSTMMTHNNLPQFAKMRIPEAVIKYVSNRYQVTIQSSPKRPQPGDFLIGPSKAVWDRLKGAEPQRTTESADRYFFR